MPTDLNKIDFDKLLDEKNFEWKDTSIKKQNRLGIKAHWKLHQEIQRDIANGTPVKEAYEKRGFRCVKLF